jgi:hypothetical protein
MSFDLGLEFTIFTHVKLFKLLKNMLKECKQKIFSIITNASVLPELVFFGSPKHIGSATL